MKPILSILAFLLLLTTQRAFSQKPAWKNIPATTTSSFRGLSVADDSVAWVSGTKGYVGISTNGGNDWAFAQVKGFEQCDFRSLYAFDSKKAIIANAGAPAYILATTDGGDHWQVVYKNEDSAAFFDGIGFWDSKAGIIYGDPIGSQMMVLRTNDGGLTWQALPKESRPVLQKDEASFAASGTAIRCTGKNNTIIATGGKASRLLSSTDRGATWVSIKTPILQGLPSTGIFSVAIAGDKDIIIVGGDYKRDSLCTANAFISNDNGKTWHTPAKTTRGYRECAEMTDKKTAIATGPGGSDISYDQGQTWQPLSDEKQFHVVRKSRKGNLVIMAGGSGKICVLRR